jgi:pimeloyl-ACP methyl ester carboxylesterase
MQTSVIKALGIYLELLARIAPRAAARKGFQLFCRPTAPAPTPRQLEFLNSAEKFTIDHDGFCVQAYRWGSGEKKILFLHGWQSHSYRWKAYIEALPKEDFTIYALDAPGHGLSSGHFLTVPLYSTLIRNFIKEQGGLHAAIGHSLGGFSLLHALYEAPDLSLDRVVLLAPPGEASDFISVFQKTLGLSDRTVKLVTDYFAHRYGVGPDFFSSQRFATNLRVRGLIIHDVDDTEAPYRYSPRLHAAWQASTLISTKGFGHNLKSISVVKTVADFVREPVLSNV